MVQPLAPRTRWPADFPDVIVHASTSARDRHPFYAAAKAGDFQAALVLVNDLVSDAAINLLQQTVGHRRAIIAAVAAIEKNGFNAIPDAMAHNIGARLGLPVDDGELRQTNIVAHTRASGWHRIVTPPTFGGKVEAGRDYLLIDDHIGLGGTLANMRGYVETNGGSVIATTLTQSRDANKIALTPETLNVLRLKHGEELEHFWLEIFGYGLDCLTEVEASYIARQPTFDAVTRRMVEATEKAHGGGLSAVSIDRN